MGFTTIKFLLLSQVESSLALAVLLASFDEERAHHRRRHRSFINRRENLGDTRVIGPAGSMKCEFEVVFGNVPRDVSGWSILAAGHTESAADAITILSENQRHGTRAATMLGVRAGPGTGDLDSRRRRIQILGARGGQTKQSRQHRRCREDCCDAFY